MGARKSRGNSNEVRYDRRIARADWKKQRHDLGQITVEIGKYKEGIRER